MFFINFDGAQVNHIVFILHLAITLTGHCIIFSVDRIMKLINGPLIESQRTYSRLGKNEDIEEIIRFHRDNDADHFAPWSPEIPENFYTQDYWKAQLKKSRQEFNNDQSLRLFTYLKENDQLIATINFTTFERGPFQNCRLGYKIGSEFEGKGLMRESLESSIKFVFSILGFHRIEANFIPQNKRSQKLLKRLDFQEVGLSRNYLKIHGQWQDHILSYLINPQWNEYGKA